MKGFKFWINFAAQYEISVGQIVFGCFLWLLLVQLTQNDCCHLVELCSKYFTKFREELYVAASGFQLTGFYISARKACEQLQPYC